MIGQVPSSLRERLSSPLTLHYAVLTVLLALFIGTLVKFCFAWSAAHGSDTGSVARKHLQLEQLNLDTAPFRGLDKRVAQSRSQAQDFYAKRIPASYSSIVTRIGELEVKSGARLSRVQYSQGHMGADLVEISMDASISGEYPQIMRFVNGMERDQTFFVVRAMALTGQQGGTVNLRLRVSSWLRASDAASSGLPLTPETPTSGPSAVGKGGE
jgi:type IV pilus assembly protein PilO